MPFTTFRSFQVKQIGLTQALQSPLRGDVGLNTNDLEL